MGIALAGLIAYLLPGTLVIYWVGLMLLGGKKLTTTSKIVGFLFALPMATIATLILAPVATVVSAQTMIFPGCAIGAAVGVAMIIVVGKKI